MGEDSYLVKDLRWVRHGRGLVSADFHLEGRMESMIYHHLLEEARLSGGISRFSAPWDT